MSQAGQINTISSNPSIPTSFQTDVGVATPIANLLYVVGGNGLITTGATNVITIYPATPTTGWFEVTSADNPVQLEVGNGYIAKGASPVNFVLPPAAEIGDMIHIQGYGNLWTIEQNAFQSMILGLVQTAPGVTHGFSATTISDSTTLICVSQNLEFKLNATQGNLQQN